MEPTSLLGPIKLAWDKLVDRARGELVVRFGVHHAYLDGQVPAFFINVQNQSPQRSVMVTHVLARHDAGLSDLDQAVASQDRPQL